MTSNLKTLRDKELIEECATVAEQWVLKYTASRVFPGRELEGQLRYASDVAEAISIQIRELHDK